MKASVLIWDSEDSPPNKSAEHILLWRRYGEGVDSSLFSIPKLVENGALELRSRYLAWIYELGEKKYRDKRIVEHLQLRPNLSYWWMTLLVEKCNFAKSPQIDDAIRILALEKWLSGREINCIRLVSANANLASVIKNWCCENNVKFEWRKAEEKREQTTSLVHATFRRLPLPLQALIGLFYKVWVSWPLRGVGVDSWRVSTAEVTFVSYLFNLVPQAALVGSFESRYWADLPKKLAEKNTSTRWLHVWVKDGVAPTAKKARELIEYFNKSESGIQVHAVLESFIGLRPILATIKDLLRMLWLGMRLEKTLADTSGEAGFNIWPLFKADWRKSMYGMEAMSNLFMLNMLQEAFVSIPSQTVGAYLQENQGWEFGLVSVWRQYGHRRLISVPHSTVRFWDMRYHFDPRNLRLESKLCLPWPDCIAVNGPAMKAALSESGYLTERLADVEALRYLHLINAYNQKTRVLSGRRRLLVIGDYLNSNTAVQMKLLEVCVTAMESQPIDIVVKPHPACPVNPDDYPGIDFIVTGDSLGQLLLDCDLAYASSVTSGAVDAYCAGVPVVSVLDENSLNLSPLRGLPNVCFISKPQELACVIENVSTVTRAVEENVPYFNLDASLSGWMHLLRLD